MGINKFLHFNWSIGGYQQITKNHPEWAEKAFVGINLEGFVAHDEYDYHHIRTAYEYQGIGSMRFKKL